MRAHAPPRLPPDGGPGTPADWRGLVAQAWRVHYREPAQLVPLGLAVVHAAGEGTAGAAAGWLFVALGRRFAGEREAAHEAQMQAQRLARLHEAEDVLANLRDLQAMSLNVSGQPAQALALLALNDSPAARARSVHERCLTHARRAAAHDGLGHRDEALRERYAQLTLARDSGDEAVVATALAMLCGNHADQFNHEEADRLGAEAMRLAEAAEAFSTWSLAALNRLNALASLRRASQALPIVRRLQAAEPRMHARTREQRLIVYADCLAQAGAVDEAQALLDESLRQRNSTSASPLSFATAQLLTHEAAGRHAEARAVAEAWLADPQQGSEPGSVPSELLRLLRGLSAACEALGDPVAALAYERRAFEVHDTLVGRSARARRLVLEIEHDLERERWQREQAEQARQAAEHERTRLDELNRALEAANAAKTRFLAAASHDLRQPVQALALYLAALQREDEPVARAHLQQQLGASVGALTRMFEVLLDISRLDAGTVTALPRALDLAALMRRLHREQLPTAEARGLALKLWLPRRWRHGPPPRVVSDPVLLERCLRNLIDNALKYTRHGGVLLALRGGPGEGVRLQVFDTGIGMDATTLHHACDEFFQAGNPERDREQGLGLGLAIVQRVSGLLGHPLQLRSEPGRGTRAQLTLALQRPSAAEAGAGDAPTEAADSRFDHFDDSPSPRLCLVVIDDDSAVREGLGAALRSWGHRVLSGIDEAEVLTHWRGAGEPEVHGAIVDLRLRGGHDGLRALEGLRAALGPALPALVVTGDIAPDRLQRLRTSGLPWLAKPVMPMRLRSWLSGLPR